MIKQFPVGPSLCAKSESDEEVITKTRTSEDNGNLPMHRQSTSLGECVLVAHSL